jgi:hypothetical protein
MGKDFYRYIARAVRFRWLECGQTLALRIPLAGLFKFAIAFGKEAMSGLAATYPSR